MLRAIGVLGLLAGIFALVAVKAGWWQSSSPEVTLPECRLLAGPCSWETGEGAWQAKLTPGEEGDQGVAYRLAITAPEAPDRFLAVLRGQSMYMGEYPVPLQQTAPTQFEATFTAPFCTTGAAMVWRIDLQDGQNVVENVPMTLVFKAQK